MLREEEMERERIWRGSVLHSLKGYDNLIATLRAAQRHRAV